MRKKKIIEVYKLIWSISYALIMVLMLLAFLFGWGPIGKLDKLDKLDEISEMTGELVKYTIETPSNINQ